MKRFRICISPTDTTARRLQLVGAEKAKANPDHRGDEEYNFFLAVAFPSSHLKIIDYNRVVKDLNGFTPEEFLDKLRENFEVADMGAEIYQPSALHNFSLYLGGVGIASLLCRGASTTPIQ